MTNYTKSKLLKAKVLSLVLIICYCLGGGCVLSAQLVIFQNSKVYISAQDTLSTFEPYNQFEEAITGTGWVYFGGPYQDLTSLDKVVLPNLILKDASKLCVSSSLVIRGDLELRSDTFLMEYPLWVEGAIHLGEKAYLLEIGTPAAQGLGAQRQFHLHLGLLLVPIYKGKRLYYDRLIPQYLSIFSKGSNKPLANYVLSIACQLEGKSPPTPPPKVL